MAVIECKAPRKIKREISTPEPDPNPCRTMPGSQIQCQPLKIGRQCKGTSVCLSAPRALAAGAGAPTPSPGKWGQWCLSPGPAGLTGHAQHWGLPEIRVCSDPSRSSCTPRGVSCPPDRTAPSRGQGWAQQGWDYLGQETKKPCGISGWGRNCATS